MKQMSKDVESASLQEVLSYRYGTLVENILVAGIAIVLMFTGLVHLGNPSFFLSSILKYDLVPLALAKQMAIVLPFLHVALAICLVLSIFKVSSLQIAAVLFAAYALAQGLALLRGVAIECGCFGIDSEPVGIWSLAKVFLFMTATLCILLLEVRRSRFNRSFLAS